MKSLLHEAQLSPFEARGQVFVVANAESLIGGAADTLLKAMEEPYETAPRNFLLLAPSQFDLLPTLRSRSLSLYLGAGEGLIEVRDGATCRIFEREQVALVALIADLTGQK